jgi:hypothetical protein
MIPVTKIISPILQTPPNLENFGHIIGIISLKGAMRVCCVMTQYNGGILFKPTVFNASDETGIFPPFRAIATPLSVPPTPIKTDPNSFQQKINKIAINPNIPMQVGMRESVAKTNSKAGNKAVRGIFIIFNFLRTSGQDLQ